MKLPISQLQEGENHFQFHSERDAWVRKVVETLNSEGYAFRGPLEVDVRLTKLEPDYYLKGRLSCEVDQSCARCVETFPFKVTHSFEVAMAHVSQSKVNRSALSEESEELDINFFEGNEIDLSPVVGEQFFLSIPYQSLCDEQCRGICQHCGQNLNNTSCDCASRMPAGAFSLLEKLGRQMS